MTARRILTPSETHLLIAGLEIQAGRFAELSHQGEAVTGQGPEFWREKERAARGLSNELRAGLGITEVVIGAS